MTTRVRTAGVCPLCGARITQVVDDFMVEGVAEPFDTQVLRSRCTPGCPGVQSD